jgi:hypothetical protein
MRTDTDSTAWSTNRMHMLARRVLPWRVDEREEFSHPLALGLLAVKNKTTSTEQRTDKKGHICIHALREERTLALQPHWHWQGKRSSWQAAARYRCDQQKPPRQLARKRASTAHGRACEHFVAHKASMQVADPAIQKASERREGQFESDKRTGRSRWWLPSPH